MSIRILRLREEQPPYSAEVGQLVDAADVVVGGDGEIIKHRHRPSVCCTEAWASLLAEATEIGQGWTLDGPEEVAA